MKKRRVLICFIMTAVLTGCGNAGTAERAANPPAGVSDVLKAEMQEADSQIEKDSPVAETSPDVPDIFQESEPGTETPEPEPAGETEIAMGSTEGIDVDLTQLSSTMVYAEVYNMMIAPDNYVGKTVKMKGMFSTYNDEATNQNYYACIIADATACCSQGIEFVLTDDYKYPDDYPEEAEDICVIGVFDTYQQDGITYCTLRDARLG